MCILKQQMIRKGNGARATTNIHNDCKDIINTFYIYVLHSYDVFLLGLQKSLLSLHKHDDILKRFLA